MFRVLCLGIWWQHEIWIFEKLKFDYLKNENNFWSEMKNVFPCIVLWFILTKQTIKNVADATFQMNLDLKNL